MQPASIPPLLLKVPEAASALGLGKSSIYQLVKSGKLRAVTVGTVLRFRPSDLATFVEQLAGDIPGNE